MSIRQQCCEWAGLISAILSPSALFVGIEVDIHHVRSVRLVDVREYLEELVFSAPIISLSRIIDEVPAYRLQHARSTRVRFRRQEALALPRCHAAFKLLNLLRDNWH